MAIKGQPLWVEYVCLGSDGLPLSGDLSNHTIAWAIDNGTDVTATNNQGGVGYHVEATGGRYKILLTAAETACDSGTLSGSSGTTGAIIVPRFIELSSENLILAKTNLINTGGSVTVTAAPVYGDDVTILIGQDHLISNGLDLGITGPSWWPVLTGGSVVYELRAGNTVYKQFTGTIVAAKQVTCELTKAVTALINPGNYAFRVLGTEATGNGGETTVLVEGRAIVQY